MAPLPHRGDIPSQRQWPKAVARSEGSPRLWPLAVAIAILALVWLWLQSIPPQQALVSRVIDGDTIELANGDLVRYIGVDTPEVRRRQGERWVEDPEPFGREATEANRRLVEGRLVRLEYDVQPRDRYNRWLAYVYVGDRMVNAALLEDGYAQPMTIPPNIRHAEEFRRLTEFARQSHRGLWAED